ASQYDRYPMVQKSHKSSISIPNSISNSISNNSLSNPSKRNLQITSASPFGGYPFASFPLLMDEKENDDYIHNPDPIQDANYEKNHLYYDLKSMDKKSFIGLLSFLFLFFLAIGLFILLPILTFTNTINHHKHSDNYTILSPYSYPILSAIRSSLIDPDTPEQYLTTTSKDSLEWSLVFSDEFNKEGRTFYEGDDQFWQAADLHYAGTKDLEWFDPDAIITSNGVLNIRVDAFQNHGLFYRSGMLQSWNKMCFTQGKYEVSAQLPNSANISGLWPGIWTMGNLGRPGYLSTTDGVWPYAYDSCDAGITPNQSSFDGINFLPGQKLNSCTCKGEDHPNRGIGRGAPEIDAVEASVDTRVERIGSGVVSQSLQIAPYDIWYVPDYDFIELHNSSVTSMNTWCGGPFQEAVSAITTLNNTWYEFESGLDEPRFQKFSFEYLNDDTNGYIKWFVGDDPTMTLYPNALHPTGNIDWRTISKEPMSMILNLGISDSWAYIDWPSIRFPSTMKIDYVRVYQPKDQINVGCDPDEYPTYNYIQDHSNAYSNANLTSWADAGYTFPKNSLVHGC
ncbi:SKN1/KRE6 family beta-glucan synthesis-associated protein, partial [Ascoidea rubescens DSM 1968]